MAAIWSTKYGTRRVRHDPPTLAEAIVAAQGLSDELAAQIEIAASLMGVSAEAVKAEMQKLSPIRRAVRVVETTARDRAPRTVIVERKVSRRMVGRPV